MNLTPTEKLIYDHMEAHGYIHVMQMSRLFGNEWDTYASASILARCHMSNLRKKGYAVQNVGREGWYASPSATVYARPAGPKRPALPPIVIIHATDAYLRAHPRGTLERREAAWEKYENILQARVARKLAQLESTG